MDTDKQSVSKSVFIRVHPWFKLMSLNNDLCIYIT